MCAGVDAELVGWMLRAQGFREPKAILELKSGHPQHVKVREDSVGERRTGFRTKQNGGLCLSPWGKKKKKTPWENLRKILKCSTQYHHPTQKRYKRYLLP